MISSILTGSKTKLSRLMLETVPWCSLAERDDETLLATSQFISLFNSKIYYNFSTFDIIVSI